MKVIELLEMSKLKKVAVWGKFDGTHQGHLEFLRHARELGDELYVVVIPDEKVRENSGEPPAKTAEARKRELIGLDFIRDVYVDSLSDGLQSILRLRPDVFAFGHDQKTQWEEKLQQYLSSQGLHLEYVYLGIYNNGIHTKDFRHRVEKRK